MSFDLESGKDMDHWLEVYIPNVVSLPEAPSSQSLSMYTLT